MRIIAGKYRHILLEAPLGTKTRPTMDRVKEALFSILNFKIQGKVVLDLFAGSGGLGIEALSRDAGYVYFNDCSIEAIKIIKKNLAKLPQCSNYQVSQSDYLSLIRTNDVVYDIVILDPPYQANIYASIIDELIKLKRLSARAIMVIECDQKNQDFIYPGFQSRVYNYGNKSLIILTKEN
jgi:16S rRNA (guanine966-N2)-methyltransferase